MSPPRFFVSPLPAIGLFELDSAEARHASNVLRLKPGDAIVVFDGQGGEAVGHIEQIAPRKCQVNLTERTDTCRELDGRLHMYVALPKGDRQKTLVDGLTQIGVQRLIPLITQRGVAQPTAKAAERLQRQVVESCKQCGRNQLMEIAEPVDVGQLSQLGDAGDQRLVLHPYGEGVSRRIVVGESGTLLAIGPEGGFIEDEVQELCAGGWQQVALGQRILRIEAAALSAAAIAAHELMCG